MQQKQTQAWWEKAANGIREKVHRVPQKTGLMPIFPAWHGVVNFFKKERFCFVFVQRTNIHTPKQVVICYFITPPSFQYAFGM